MLIILTKGAATTCDDATNIVQVKLSLYFQSAVFTGTLYVHYERICSHVLFRGR